MRLDIPTRKIIIRNFPIDSLLEKEEYINIALASKLAGVTGHTIRDRVKKGKIKCKKEFDKNSKRRMKITKVLKSDVIEVFKRDLNKSNHRKAFKSYIPKYSVDSDPYSVLGTNCFRIIRLIKNRENLEDIIEKLGIKHDFVPYVKEYCVRLEKKSK